MIEPTGPAIASASSGATPGSGFVARSFIWRAAGIVPLPTIDGRGGSTIPEVRPHSPADVSPAVPREAG